MLSDVDAFIAYVGADRKNCDPGLEDPCGLNRARVSKLLLGMGRCVGLG